MYQPNIPGIYRDLNQANYKWMSIVIICGSAICVLIYVLVAVYGYVTFVGTDQEEVLTET